mmetsp:Transcript_16781/g.41550  ORF Transcript_16781/g.41550 Transcript_16781/m.41550 type:complete len:303 (+) Transcript_16781:249-1157(+)
MQRVVSDRLLGLAREFSGGLLELGQLGATANRPAEDQQQEQNRATTSSEDDPDGSRPQRDAGGPQTIKSREKVPVEKNSMQFSTSIAASTSAGSNTNNTSTLSQYSTRSGHAHASRIISPAVRGTRGSSGAGDLHAGPGGGGALMGGGALIANPSSPRGQQDWMETSDSRSRGAAMATRAPTSARRSFWVIHDVVDFRSCSSSSGPGGAGPSSSLHDAALTSMSREDTVHRYFIPGATPARNEVIEGEGGAVAGELTWGCFFQTCLARSRCSSSRACSSSPGGWPVPRRRGAAPGSFSTYCT